MGSFFYGNQAMIMLVIVWSLVWKIWSLWIAARRSQKIWFGVLMVVNTMGILEILYIFIFSKMKREAKKTFTTEEAKQIGEKLGINWSKYDVEQFRMGLDVELEHGVRDPHTDVTNDDGELTGKIALAHLNEFADYYTRLARMEQEADAFWGKKD
jgi:hypothetical protein